MYNQIAIKLILEALGPWIGLYFLIVLGMPLWIVSLQVARLLKKRIPSPLPGGLKEGVFLFAFAFLMHLSATWSLGLLIGNEEEDPSLSSRLMLNVLVQGSVYLIALLCLFRLKGLQGVKQAGFQWKRPWTNFVFGMGAYFAFYPVYLLAAFINSLVITPEPQELVKELIDDPSLYGSLPVILSAAFIIPMLEEILFRGYLLSGLCAVMRPVPAILLSAAVFAFLHEAQARIPVFALGCILGYLRYRTGSLAPAVFVHALHNSIMLSAIPFL